ncbi:M23 family metallopeptidase [Staphylococcus hominis]|uniref:M23 family metallopeptidase n=1 Tax=Staphylococcus hominis TaxID=1290 RepID=UPI0011A5CCC4|nr:M23 family metallopeptidase [Staphylococcus hominis]
MKYEILKDIEENNYKKVYKNFNRRLKKQVKKRELKKIFKLYNSYNFNHILYREVTWGEYKQYIWLDSQYNGGVSLTIDANSGIKSLVLKKMDSVDDFKETKLEYSMPIKEDWTVFWGGDNELVNYHHIYKNQRFAYDLVITKNGKSSNFNHNSNDCFYAYNKDVVSPADGKIIDLENKIHDNDLGVMNKEKPAGNYIVIKHKNDEYSFIAHFKQNSIEKEIGEFIKKGEVIGKCGNSGNSSEPHIHFQVMDRPCLNSCESLKIKFTNKIDPMQGDIVQFS